MRTTLTLDDDVAAGLKAEARRSRQPFRSLVNDLLRSSLLLRRKRHELPRFKVRPRALGRLEGLDYDRTAELIEQLEGPRHR